MNLSTLYESIKQLMDEVEPLLEIGGNVIDWHSSELFPERLIDLVLVLRCDHTRLWSRLEKRQVFHY